MSIKNTSPPWSPVLAPVELESTHTPPNIVALVPLDGAHGEGASFSPSTDSKHSSKNLAGVLRTPGPLPAASSPEVGSSSMSAELIKELEHASALINNGHPTAAMHFLASVPGRFPEAQNQYAYHARNSMAFLGHIDALNEKNQLGDIALTATTQQGRVIISELTAERIGCYIGVCGSHSKFLQLLNEPDIRRRFVEKNRDSEAETEAEAVAGGEAELAKCRSGVEHGLRHSVLEIRLVLSRLAQCNTYKATSRPQYPITFFPEAQADPLYDQLTEVGREVNAQIDDSGEPHEHVWDNWRKQERKRIDAIPEVASALGVILGAFSDDLGD